MSERDRPATSWVTYGLIALNLLGFAYELSKGLGLTSPSPQQMLEVGGNYAPQTLRGEPWRLVTAMFLHVGALHLAVNMFTLFRSRAVESALGSARFLTVYVAAGLLGGIATVAHSTNVVSAGASGAVFGIFGAYAAFLLVNRKRLDPAFLSQTAKSFGMIIVINLVIGFTVPNIDMAAHIGGLLGGFLVAAALLVGARAESQKLVGTIAVAVVALGVTAGALALLKPPVDVQAVLAELDAIERVTVADFNANLDRGRAETITEAQLASRIEQDIVPRVRSFRTALQKRAAGDPDAAALAMIVDRYAAAREDAMVAFIRLLRAPEREQAAAAAEYERLNDALPDALTRLEAEVKAFQDR